MIVFRFHLEELRVVTHLERSFNLSLFGEVFAFVFCGTRQEDAKAIRRKEKFFEFIGMTYAEVEGYIQQKAIATLFFEVTTLPLSLLLISVISQKMCVDIEI